MRYINLIYRNYYNDIIIKGIIGKRIYTYYTKTQAIRLYNKEAKEKQNG